MAELDAGQYIEGVRELMTAYNGSGDEDIYHALYELCYAPNEAALRENYARNAAHYAERYDAPVLPSYDDLPVLLFPVTNNYSVLFDKTARGFCMNEERGLFALLHILLFADETAILQAAKHFRRAENEVRAHTLAQEIEAAIRAQDFGERSRSMAEEYHALCPWEEGYELFCAEAALVRDDVENAIRYGEAAYQKRKMGMRACALLARAYAASGQLDRALLFQVLSRASSPESLPEMDVELRAHCLRALTAGCTPSRYAPLIREVYEKDGILDTQLCIKVGEEVLRFSEDLPRYRIGVYNPYGLMHIRSSLIDVMNAATKDYQFLIYNDFIFDIMKADAANSAHIDPKGASMLLPLAAKEAQQTLFFQSKNINRSMVLGRGEFNFYRIDEPVTIRANQPFLVGTPIRLGHGEQRKKFVLNILADGLSWKEMQHENYTLVPNMIRFFEKGVIFDNNFSTAEYTYPALATIETGLYQHHTQIAEPGQPFVLDPAYVTISEQMKNLGYYCVNIQGDGEGIYNGATRGYNRLIVNHTVELVADGVERTIRHLREFDECDNFLFMHFADSHPYNSDISVPAGAGTHLSLADVLQEQDMEASVFLKPNPLSQYVNRSAIQTVDRQLGYLFDYIEQHYEDDEYIVMLYSDHGASVYARSPYLMSEEQTGSALMARGAGVPALGRVDELTSSVDIYKILGKLAGYPIDAAHLDGNLPEAFGGKRREYTVSNSIYPGQTYKICVRTEHYAFHLETAEFTREDGTISLDRYTYHIHERSESYREVFDDALARYFMDIVWKYTESFRR